MLENPSIKYGLYGGIACIVLDLILYLINEKLYLNGNSLIGLIIIIPAMVYAAKEFRTLNGGYAGFKDLFKASWLSYLILGLLTSIFAYLMLNFIAPSLKDTLMQASLEASEKMRGLIGEEAADKMVEELEKNDPGSVKTTLVNLISKYFFAAILAAIIALIMRKEKSEFA
jgi:hypothetical protein